MADTIVYDVEDASGDAASTSVHITPALTIAQATGFAAGYATVMNNIIAGVIRSATLYLKAVISGLTFNTMDSLADVEHVGKFSFLTDAGNRVLINIPALAEATIGTLTSDSIDQSQADVAAFIAAMEDGIAVTGGLIEPCDIGEDDIVQIVFAREAFRNSGARR